MKTLQSQSGCSAPSSILRRLWPHKLLVKGILRADDALLAAENGADGIFISNHGGRALDGALSPIEALPAIRAAVGKRLTLMVDSGMRRGELFKLEWKDVDFHARSITLPA